MLKAKRVETVHDTENILDLLEILAAGAEELHIGDLADKLHIGRNKALLLLVTLESRGMVRWDDREKIYRAGRKSEEMARQFLRLDDTKTVDSVAAVSQKGRRTKAKNKRPVSIAPCFP